MRTLTTTLLLSFAGSCLAGLFSHEIIPPNEFYNPIYPVLGLDNQTSFPFGFNITKDVTGLLFAATASIIYPNGTHVKLITYDSYRHPSMNDSDYHIADRFWNGTREELTPSCHTPRENRTFVVDVPALNATGQFTASFKFAWGWPTYTQDDDSTKCNGTVEYSAVDDDFQYFDVIANTTSTTTTQHSGAYSLPPFVEGWQARGLAGGILAVNLLVL